MCRELLLNDSRPADADLFNFWWPDVALPQLSLYRCQGSGSGSCQLSQEPVYSGDLHILRPARTSTLIDRGARPPPETGRSGSWSLQQSDRTGLSGVGSFIRSKFASLRMGTTVSRRMASRAPPSSRNPRGIVSLRVSCLICVPD